MTKKNRPLPQSIQFIFDFDPELEFYLSLGAFRNGDFLGVYFSIEKWIEYATGRSPFNKFDEEGVLVPVDSFFKLKIVRENFDGNAFDNEN